MFIHFSVCSLIACTCVDLPYTTILYTILFRSILFYSFLLRYIILYLLPSLYPTFREGVATRELARLYRDNGAVDKAAECYYHHLLLTGGGALVTAVQKVILGVVHSEILLLNRCLLFYIPIVLPLFPSSLTQSSCLSISLISRDFSSPSFFLCVSPFLHTVCLSSLLFILSHSSYLPFIVLTSSPLPFSFTSYMIQSSTYHPTHL